MSNQYCSFCNDEFEQIGDETRCMKCRNLAVGTTSESAEPEGISTGSCCLIIAIVGFIVLAFAWQWYTSVAFVNWQG